MFSFPSLIFQGNHPHSKLGGALGEAAKDAFPVVFLVVDLAPVGVFLALGEQGADQPRQLVGGGGEGRLVNLAHCIGERGADPQLWSAWRDRLPVNGDAPPCRGG